MVLKIDSTNREEITVELIDKKSGSLDKLVQKQKLGSQVLLPMIVKILKKNKKTFKDLSRIHVNMGPGSFTGTRVGVAIANALGFALGLPVLSAGLGLKTRSEGRQVNGKRSKIVEPVYEKSKFD